MTLSGFAYNQSVELSATDQTVYQQDVVVHRSSGDPYEEFVGGVYVLHFYVGDKCKADYGDIRFTGESGNELFYYLWPDHDAESARFAVRLEGADQSGALVIWYGNPSATTTSDGDVTFLFFDHFDGVSFDPEKWTIAAGNRFSVAGSVLTVSGYNAYQTLETKQTFPIRTRTEWLAQFNSFSGGDTEYIGYGYGGQGFTVFPPSYNKNKYSLSATVVGWGNPTSSQYAALGTQYAGNYHRYEVERTSESATKFYIDDVLVASLGESGSTGSNPLAVNAWVNGLTVKVDYVIVRAYSATPPTAITFSGEQIVGEIPPPYVSFYADPSTGYAPLTVQFNDLSSGSPTAWVWDFGDGDVSTEQSPVHTYLRPGVYTVSLTATNEYGSTTDVREEFIVVNELITIVETIRSQPTTARATIPLVVTNTLLVDPPENLPGVALTSSETIRSVAFTARATIPLVVTNTLLVDPPENLPGVALTSSETIRSTASRMFIREFDESISVRDLLITNGVIPTDLYESIPISEEVSPSPVKFLLELDDSVSIDEELPQSFTFDERVRIFEDLGVKHFIPGQTHSLFGTQWVHGSENLGANATIHLIKRYTHPILVDQVTIADEVSLKHTRNYEVIGEETVDGGSVFGVPEAGYRDVIPDGNATDFRTVSDENGFFEMAGVPTGVYVIVSIKPGHAIGMTPIDLREDTQVDLTMYPLEAWEVVERPYNLFGHIFKIYFYNNVLYGDYRVVDGLIVFGDLYGIAADQAPIGLSGYLNVLDRYTLGQVGLINTPFVGKRGFFNKTTEWVRENTNLTEITWNSDISRGDFDGFCFRYVFPGAMSGVINLSLAAPIPAPFPGGGSGSGGSRGSGSGSGSRRSGSGSRDSDSGSGRDSDSGSGRDSGGSPGSYPPSAPPIWNPEFSLMLSDRLAVRDDDCSIAVIRGGKRMWLVSLYDGVYLGDLFDTPPRLRMSGVVRDVDVRVYSDPSTGEETIQREPGTPVAGALVILKAVRNGRIVGESSTDENGFWQIANLESELEYDVFIVDVVDRTRYSICQRVQVYDRDVIDSAVQALIESEGLTGSWANQHYDVKIVLPPMETRKDYDGRVYGLVKDAVSKETLSGALVEVYPGHISEDEIRLLPGPTHVYYTTERWYVDKGFFEIYLPRGDYTVRALKNGYVTSGAHPVSIRSGAELDIELYRCTVDGVVYDGPAYSAGILKPISGATIVFNQVSAESQSDGSYVVTADVVPEQRYVITCSKTDYVTVTKAVFATSQSIRGVMFVMWPVSQYSRRT